MEVDEEGGQLVLYIVPDDSREQVEFPVRLFKTGLRVLPVGDVSECDDSAAIVISPGRNRDRLDVVGAGRTGEREDDLARFRPDAGMAECRKGSSPGANPPVACPPLRLPLRRAGLMRQG